MSRQKFLSILTALFLSLWLPATGHAAPIQWSSSIGGNDHWYDLIGPAYWEDAKILAESQSYLGMQGYLATITSAAENAFVAGNFGGNEPWIGGSDKDEEGIWRWAGGPEGSQIFWTSGLGMVTYANWASGEPSNTYAWTGWMWEYENNLQMLADGTWNDLHNYYNPFTYPTWRAAVVEYGGLASIPEPSSILLLASGIAGLAGLRKWKWAKKK